MQDLRTPRQVKTQQVKKNILKATTDLIKHYGIEYVTVSNICKQSGVSTGSFYHHFINKDALLAYYLVDAFEKKSDEFDEITGTNIVENILRCYTLYNEFLVEQGLEFVRNFYTTSNKGLYSRQNFAGAVHFDMPVSEKLRTLLYTAKENGYLVDSVNVEQLLYDISIIEKGLIFDWCLCDGDYDMVKETNRLLKAHMMSSIVSEKYRHEYGER